MPDFSLVSLNRRILVVDDQLASRALTSALLSSAGYIVECAYDGLQALTMIESRMFDLVLLDIEMPGLDGHETASAMLHAERGAIRLAALTVDSSVARRRRSAEVGMQAHIAKPISPGELLLEVARLCDLALQKQPDPWHRQDYKELVNRLGLDRVFVYLQQFRQRLLKFLTSEGEDLVEIRRAAHDLASIGGMMGFLSFSRCCVDFMQARGFVDEQSFLQKLIEAGRQAEGRIAEYVSSRVAVHLIAA